VRELVRYLLEHAFIDFEGDITMDEVRQMLREDDSREARALLSKLIEDKGVDDMLETLADVLRESIRDGITEETVREQLVNYAES
jgi:Mn-containing catalase